MRRLLWPLGLVLAFGLGLAAGGWPVLGPFTTQEVARLRASESRLQFRVSTLEARLRAGGGFSTGHDGSEGVLAHVGGGPLAKRSLAGATADGYASRAFSSREAAPASGPRAPASHRDTPVAATRVLLRPRTPR